MKKRMEDDEPPREREERTERIVHETRGNIREEPEYTETEEQEPEQEESRRPPKAPQKPSSLTVKYSLDEMRHDIAAHIAVINQTATALERTGMPAHIAQALTQNICSANIQRAKDIESVLKQYGQ